MHAIGRIALEIFNSNFNVKTAQQSPVKTRPANANIETLRQMLHNDNLTNDYCQIVENSDDVNDLQKDFVIKCLNVNKSNPISIETIWNHPFINIIYSLRVLSVFSIFNYFQDQAKDQAKAQAKKASSSAAAAAAATAKNNNTLNMSKISEEKSKTNKMSKTNENSVGSNLNQANNSLRPRSAQSNKQDSSFSSMDKFKEKRKVSLTFLSNFNNLTLPPNFFAILDDIRYGLYPRIFKVKIVCNR